MNIIAMSYLVVTAQSKGMEFLKTLILNGGMKNVQCDGKY
jgi:hypothetical protein